MANEALEPRPWCLTEAVEGFGEKAYGVRALRVDEARWLLAVDLLLKIAMEEGVGDVKLVSRPVCMVQIVAGLTTGENVSPKSMPGCWWNPRTTQRAL